MQSHSYYSGSSSPTGTQQVYNKDRNSFNCGGGMSVEVSIPYS